MIVNCLSFQFSKWPRAVIVDLTSSSNYERWVVGLTFCVDGSLLRWVLRASHSAVLPGPQPVASSRANCIQCTRTGS